MSSDDDPSNWMILSGNSNQPLARKVSEALGKKLADTRIGRFSDGEIMVEIGENVRGRSVYVVQSTCPPVNDNLMELLVLIDALHRASAEEITAVIPYYGYSRQDRKVAARTPISARLVANLIAEAGATRVVAMDLHAGQIQGFFDIPSDNLFAMPVMIDHIKANLMSEGPIVVVSPDAGGVERARAYAKRLDASVAMIDKRRTAPNEAKAMHVVGEVNDRVAVVLDDMIDTAGTLVQAAQAVLDQGARKVYACATHGLLTGPAIERLEKSNIAQVMITDTIPLSEAGQKSKKISQLSVAKILAEAILRIQSHDSLSKLFI